MIGLPRKLPVIFVAIIVFPSRSITASGSNVCWYLSAVSRRHATMSSSPSLVPAFVSYDAIGAQSMRPARRYHGMFSEDMKRSIGSGKCTDIDVSLLVVGFHPSLPPLRMVISLPNGKNACPAAARYVRFGSKADMRTAKGHVRSTPRKRTWIDPATGQPKPPSYKCCKQTHLIR